MRAHLDLDSGGKACAGDDDVSTSSMGAAAAPLAAAGGGMVGQYNDARLRSCTPTAAVQ